MAALTILLLLLALTHAASGLFYRRYFYHNQQLSWNDSLTFCRRNYADLAILYSVWEYYNFGNQTQSDASADAWIGLSKDSDALNFTQWVDGSKASFQNWTNGQPDHLLNENCVFTKNNLWNNEDCTKQKTFFCYRWGPQMIVVQEMKTWNEALIYCRTNYIDLLSLNFNTEYFLVKNKSIEVQTHMIWTGLRFMNGNWFWVNWDYMGILTSLPSCPAKPFVCGARNIMAGVWENKNCEEKMNFICYKWIW